MEQSEIKSELIKSGLSEAEATDYMEAEKEFMQAKQTFIKKAESLGVETGFLVVGGQRYKGGDKYRTLLIKEADPILLIASLSKTAKHNPLEFAFLEVLLEVASLGKKTNPFTKLLIKESLMEDMGEFLTKI